MRPKYNIYLIHHSIRQSIYPPNIQPFLLPGLSVETMSEDRSATGLQLPPFDVMKQINENDG